MTYDGENGAETFVEQQADADLPARRVFHAPTHVATIAAALSVAACSGGGGGGSAGTTAADVSPASNTSGISATAASRFLAQATMGATKADIAAVQASGCDAWISAQFALPRATSHWDWLVANGYSAANFINSLSGFDQTVWRQKIVEPDQLRQRVGFALSEILVLGIDNVALTWPQFAGVAYLDILLDNAFGNYRTLLGAITTNAALGSFITFLGNTKGNPATGSAPDENYARELMQLFTLGLHRLNMDGSLQNAGGTPIETYTQADVSQLSRVFTGLDFANGEWRTPDRYRLPMAMVGSAHESGAATFLGTTIPAGIDGMAAIKQALDVVFAHPNVPPFVSKQLIQKLVTSNPSAGYVGRVAGIFADNGAGVRGDMKDVLRAILTDTEARADPAVASASAGKLREPIVRLTNWARAYSAISPSNAWPIGDTSSPSTRLGESTGHCPTVFNFFRPGYTPPNSAISNAGLVAPEFQITNELSVVGYVNFMQQMVAYGADDFKADYAAILPLAGNSQALVDEVNLVLAAGQLGAATTAAIRSAVDSIANTGASGPADRVMTAVLLTLASPDYLTLK